MKHILEKQIKELKDEIKWLKALVDSLKGANTFWTYPYSPTTVTWGYNDTGTVYGVNCNGNETKT